MTTSAPAGPRASRPAPSIRDLTVFSTAPQSCDVPRGDFPLAVRNAARWSERHGCKGMLIYTDNRLVDPWLVAGTIVQATDALRPLVAVQPVYMHPYTVAKMVASFAHLHGRRLALNMVAGGFTNDLKALGDHTPHDRRYDRLLEYTTIVTGLLRGEAVTLDGEFYTVHGLRLRPAPDAEFRPEILLSGSSGAGLQTARRLGAVAVKYPRSPQEEIASARDEGIPLGIRVGIITRDDATLAWEVGVRRFPPDRRGQLRHQLAMKTSDSHWHRELSELARGQARNGGPYWLVPFEHYRTFCPYLVGSYDEVSGELARYMTAGCRTFILDIPPDEEELIHTRVAFDRALALLAP